MGVDEPLVVHLRAVRQLDMTRSWPPVDGPAGSVWRTVAFPIRALAPLRLALTRLVRRSFWTESIVHYLGPGPEISMSSAPGIQGPEDGAGPLNHRTYTVTIDQPTCEAVELLEFFRSDPNRFSPTRLATFVPDPAPEGLQVGDELEVKIPGPWDGPIRVRHVEPDRLRLETRAGHMEAGWIEFRAAGTSDTVTFTIDSYARSGDVVFDSIYHRIRIGKYVQSEMWVQVLESIAAISGGKQRGRIQIETIIYGGATS